MPIVVDCSVTVAWSVEDEKSEVGKEILARLRDDGAIVPAIWIMEVANVLLMIVRRKRTSMTEARNILEDISILPIEIETLSQARVFESAVALADQLSLSVYDACYLELAQRRKLPLATLDAKLKTAARKIGVETL